MDAEKPSGGNCQDASCVGAIVTASSGGSIPYDGSFSMSHDDASKTCVKFKKDATRLEREDCTNGGLRPICGCESGQIAYKLYLQVKISLSAALKVVRLNCTVDGIFKADFLKNRKIS